MKYSMHPTSKFKDDLKRIKRRGYDVSDLKEVVRILAEGEDLPKQYKDHPLVGNYSGCRECHIQSDWLLVYKIDGGKLALILSRTGTHSDLFNK